MIKSLINKFWQAPESLSSEDWDKWDKEMKKKYPIKFFLFETIPDFYHYKIQSLINEFYWWIRYRTVNRNHIINTKLEPGWYDSGTLMLHSCFSILEKFIENENPFSTVDWEWNYEHRFAKNELVYLYSWWKSKDSAEEKWNLENPSPESKINFPLTGEWEEWCKKRNEHDIKVSQEEEDNLIKLIKVRKYMWT